MRAFPLLCLAALLCAGPARPVEAATGPSVAEECQEAAGKDKHASPPKRSHKWWASEEGRAAFGITDEQSKELEAIFQSFLPALRSSKADIDRYQRDVSRLLSEASASEAVVLQAIDRLEAAQSGLSRTRTLMLFRMYRVLSPEQRAKVKAFIEGPSHDSGSPSTRR
ncbi:MAG TPA: periplasmic heavy metal sensor [Vicinamibacterales bacterium]